MKIEGVVPSDERERIFVLGVGKLFPGHDTPVGGRGCLTFTYKKAKFEGRFVMSVTLYTNAAKPVTKLFYESDLGG